MSALSVEFEDVFAGRPDPLESGAADLVTAADAIERATESLRALVDGQESLSTDVIAETASQVARSLSRARRRYRSTGQALQSFAVALRPIQRDAQAALASAEYYEGKTYTLPGEIRRREGDLLRADAVEAPQWQIDQIEDDLGRLRQAQGNAQSELADARQALQSAREKIWAIADTAISAIETAIEDGRDSAWDNWNQFWEQAAGWIGEWAASVLKGILEFIGQVLAVLVAIVIVILLIVLVAIVLAVIVAAIGWVALAVIAALLVGALLLTFLIRDGLRSPQGPIIDKSKDFPQIKRPSDADSANSDDQYTSEDYGDLFEEIGRQDGRGGEEMTVIRVIAITDADGAVIGYRVQLPSTQNWSPFNTDGALNDLSADAMLALFPGLETQYEKAVWDALERAGVFENDAPILLTGWSLGGMMAGEISTDPRISGRVESIVTAGSAIDKHASEIDPSVRVTQVNNILDPVHHLELVGYDGEDERGSNWQVYSPFDWRIHNADMYGELADDLVPAVRPGDDVFFADDVEGTYEQVYEMGYTRG